MAAVLLAPMARVYASEEAEYITISVKASDDNEGLTYALDSDSPESFGTENTFRIPAGTSHTIYVKDVAGNITSQAYTPAEPSASSNASSNYADYMYTDYEGSCRSDDSGEDDNGRTINIDLELGKSGGDRAYEKRQDTPAETGEGTVYSKTYLDGTDAGEQVFYSVTTTDGDVFYLLIDQTQNDNNVYLLNQVSNKDLTALATDEDGVSEQSSGREEDDGLLKALSSGTGSDETGNAGSVSKRPSGVNKNTIIVCVIIAAGGGVYYYRTVYKKKKEQEMDAMDAADMEQFEAEADADDNEYDFGYGEEDKEQFLRDIMSRDEAEYEAVE